jgi:hypothetical protein
LRLTPGGTILSIWSSTSNWAATLDQAETAQAAGEA